MGSLSTHVLDTATGKPAMGMKIELVRITGDARDLIGSFTTNSDGRVDEQLLTGDAFQFGQYELVFYAGDYLDQIGAQTSDPKFLDIIPLRFGISDNSHYHVPLLLSPYSYSTYRGS
jgi:5-hydroxyisourate hydrolase